jgi:hypothetical protein
MLTNEQIDEMKKAWYTFEEIDSVKKSLEAVDRWEVLSEEEFWIWVRTKINLKMKEKECIK